MSETADVRTTFFDIARCKNIEPCLNGEDHPCSIIVRSQGVSRYGAFQLPEPWVGEIDVAPLLFVASNPSIGDDDESSGSAADRVIWDAHHLAFGGGIRTYIQDGFRTTRPDGSIIKPVRYWSVVRARAREAFAREVCPGKDYALTEVVHCKSRDELGVREALDTCVSAHLGPVLRVSAARVLMVMGRAAREALRLRESISQRTIAGRHLLVVCLPHPNARGAKKTLAANFSPAETALIRLALLG